LKRSNSKTRQREGIGRLKEIPRGAPLG